MTNYQKCEHEEAYIIELHNPFISSFHFSYRSGRKLALRISLKHLTIPLALLTLSLLIIPKPAYANPTVYQSSPTAHTTSGGLKSHVTNPANAYDGDNATSATFQTGIVSNGEFEVKTFDTSGAPTTELIAFVDIKIKYTAAAAADDQYRIIYWVKPSAIPTTLVDWTSSAHSVPAAGCDVWTSQREPNDDAWSWTDVSNIRVVVETSQTGANDAAVFTEYEVWVTVYSYPQPTLYVDPTDTVKSVGETFSIDIKVTGVNDLYGWEFQLSYNGTLLHGASVTEGTFLNNYGAKVSFFYVLRLNDTLGLVWVTCTLIEDIEGTTGSGVLATIGFEVKTTGSCALDLYDTKLVGYAYDVYSRRTYDITHTAEDGTFTSEEVPEFPLGAAMEIALVTVIIYVWFRRKGKNKRMRITS